MPNGCGPCAAKCLLDDLLENPKVASLSMGMFRTFVMACRWAVEQDTGSYVPNGPWWRLGTYKTRRALVDRGLVAPTDGGVRLLAGVADAQREASPDPVAGGLDGGAPADSKHANRAGGHANRHACDSYSYSSDSQNSYSYQLSIAKSATRRGALGGHTRWHVNRDIVAQDCTFCAGQSGTDRQPAGAGVAQSVPAVEGRGGLPNGRGARPVAMGARPLAMPKVLKATTEKLVVGPSAEVHSSTSVVTSPYVTRARAIATSTPPVSDESDLPGTAERLLLEHRDRAGGKINSRLMDALGERIAELLREDYTEDEVRAGLTLWRQRSAWPGALNNWVDYARRNRAGIIRSDPPTSSSPNHFLTGLTRDPLEILVGS